MTKAYYKAARKYHPDRVPKDQRAEANIKFQTLGAVYAVLSDASKRDYYDDTGDVEDDLGLNKNPNQTW